MAEPFTGEIRMFAGTFAPRGWALCDGQLVSIPQNDALFSLIGTIYGGDGRTTFGLPDLRGRVPIHAGSGPGLAPRNMGARGGAERVTLAVQHLPSHSHALRGSTNFTGDSSPTDNVPGTNAGTNLYHDLTGTPAPATVDMATPIGTTGGGQAHNNLMPFQCVNFIIALFGLFPSRN